MIDRVILHHDNAPSHTSRTTKETIESLGFEQLPHSPYSPDLAPADFHVFPYLKNELKGQRFENDGDLRGAVLKTLLYLGKSGFDHVFQSWVRRHQKRVELKGSYVEKD